MPKKLKLSGNARGRKIIIRKPKKIKPEEKEFKLRIADPFQIQRAIRKRKNKLKTKSRYLT